MATLTLEIINGINFPPMDVNGKADPYCLIKCGTERGKTKVISTTLNPEWREVFMFKIDHSCWNSCKLLIKCFVSVVFLWSIPFENGGHRSMESLV